MVIVTSLKGEASKSTPELGQRGEVSSCQPRLSLICTGIRERNERSLRHDPCLVEHAEKYLANDNSFVKCLCQVLVFSFCCVGKICHKRSLGLV